jgi:hypothetical protein
LFSGVDISVHQRAVSALVAKYYIVRKNKIDMELSANWKKLRATFSADPKKRSSKQFDHEKKTLKRKQPPTPISRRGKQTKIDKPSMDEKRATELVNGGFSET